jgi:hypothetical protein
VCSPSRQIAYQSFQQSPSPCGPGTCSFVFPAVPAQHRLVIQSVSGDDCHRHSASRPLDPELGTPIPTRAGRLEVRPRRAGWSDLAPTHQPPAPPTTPSPSRSRGQAQGPPGHVRKRSLRLSTALLGVSGDRYGISPFYNRPQRESLGIGCPLWPPCHSGGRTTPITGRQLRRLPSRQWAKSRLSRCKNIEGISPPTPLRWLLSPAADMPPLGPGPRWANGRRRTGRHPRGTLISRVTFRFPDARYNVGTCPAPAELFRSRELGQLASTSATRGEAA